MAMSLVTVLIIVVPFGSLKRSLKRSVKPSLGGSFLICYNQVILLDNNDIHAHIAYSTVQY